MKLLGFYIGGHDSNVAYSDDNGHVRYVKLERQVQRKHKKGSLDWVVDVCRQSGFVPDAICFSDGNRNGLGTCARDQLAMQVSALHGFSDVPTFCIDHHYAHVLSTWPVLVNCLGPERAICIDGRGDNQVKCSVIDRPFDLGQAHVVYSDVDSCFCLLLNRIGKFMGLSGGELDYAGKIMGAAAYGTVNVRYLSDCKSYVLTRSVEAVLDIPFLGLPIEHVCQRRDGVFFDWVASIQAFIRNQVNSLFDRFAARIGPTVYAGGCAQNTVINESLARRYDVRIPPHGYDGGISLGCLEYIALRFGKFLTIDDFPFSQQGDDLGYAGKETLSRVCDLLARNKIVGWCQGRGEVGPRALGHRSILMNPGHRDCKNILNERVKKREFWRPFAGSILVDDGPVLMGTYHPCPYMLHAVVVSPKWRNTIPGIVHVDGTCRFQTVENEGALKSFYALIEAFRERTGVPAVLNTSYNESGRPIADSKKDIIAAFSCLDIDAVCIGNSLIER